MDFVKKLLEWATPELRKRFEEFLQDEYVKARATPKKIDDWVTYLLLKIFGYDVPE